MGTPRLDRYERNGMINGGMDFFQRGTSNPLTSNSAGFNAGAFVADRFRSFINGVNGSGGTNITPSQSTVVPTFAQSGFQSRYSLQVTNNSAGNQTIAGNYAYPCFYRMEGLDYQRFSGKASTFAFWFQSSLAGTYSVAFRGVNANRSYVTSFTVAAASTWQQVVVPLTFENNWTTLDNTAALEILIACTSADPAFATTTLNQWQTGQPVIASGSTNWTATTGAIFRITQVLLYEGTHTAPVFSRSGVNITQELLHVQRYYEKSYSVDNPINTITGLSSSLKRVIATGYFSNPMDVEFKVTKRAAPTVLVYNATNGGVGVAEYNAGSQFIANRSSSASALQTSGFVFGSSTGDWVTNNFIAAEWSADAEIY